MYVKFKLDKTNIINLKLEPNESFSLIKKRLLKQLGDNKDIDLIFKGKPIKLYFIPETLSIREGDIIAIIQNDNEKKSSLFNLFINNSPASFTDNINSINNSLDIINNIILYPNSSSFRDDEDEGNNDQGEIILENNLIIEELDSDQDESLIEEASGENQLIEDSSEETQEIEGSSEETQVLEQLEEDIIEGLENISNSLQENYTQDPNINVFLNNINNFMQTTQSDQNSNIELMRTMGYLDNNLNRMALEYNLNNISLAIEWVENLR